MHKQNVHPRFWWLNQSPGETFWTEYSSGFLSLSLLWFLFISIFYFSKRKFLETNNQTGLNMKKLWIISFHKRLFSQVPHSGLPFERKACTFVCLCVQRIHLHNELIDSSNCFVRCFFFVSVGICRDWF